MGNIQYMESKGCTSFEEMAEQQEETTVVGEVVEPTLVEGETNNEE